MQHTNKNPIYFGMVTTTRSHAYTYPALASFFRWTTLSDKDRFFLIDNNADYTQPEAFPIFTIKNESPRGFSANVNQIISKCLEARADIIFLNNDLIFSKNWLMPLCLQQHSILSPLCNRDVQYANTTLIPKTSSVSNTFILKMVMELQEYLGNEASFDAIVEGHQKQAQGYYPTLNVPFFCIKIPYEILQVVGKFDEEFGNGGGEDYDYGLRAYLAGYDIQIALASYILHFQGRSSWAGGETKEEQLRREEKFFKHFISKWGMDLFELILREKVEILNKAPPLLEHQRTASLREAIKVLKGTNNPAIKL